MSYWATLTYSLPLNYACICRRQAFLFQQMSNMATVSHVPTRHVGISVSSFVSASIAIFQWRNDVSVWGIIIWRRMAEQQNRRPSPLTRRTSLLHSTTIEVVLLFNTQVLLLRTIRPKPLLKSHLPSRKNPQPIFPTTVPWDPTISQHWRLYRHMLLISPVVTRNEDFHHLVTMSSITMAPRNCRNEEVTPILIVSPRLPWSCNNKITLQNVSTITYWVLIVASNGTRYCVNVLPPSIAVRARSTCMRGCYLWYTSATPRSSSSSSSSSSSEDKYHRSSPSYCSADDSANSPSCGSCSCPAMLSLIEILLGK